MNIAAGEISKVSNVSRPAIPALTSLRLFACAMIVTLHAQNCFGIPHLATQFALGAGVSLFFVLSGFILTYSYPELRGSAAIVRFFRARVGRLWPVHAGTTAFALFLSYGNYPLDGDTLTHVIMNVFMLHTWIPTAYFTDIYNAPSWSIATEFAFYLLFPFLIVNFRTTWWWKLALSVAAAVAMMIVSSVFEISGWLTLYQHPFGRLFEFVVGMCAALAWVEWRDRFHLDRWTWTALEIAAIAIFAFSVTTFSWQSVPNVFLMWWYAAAHTAIPAAFLILVLAASNGFIKAAMAISPLVRLGEISYAVYLIHYPFLQIYWKNIPNLHGVPTFVLGYIYFSALILTSLLAYLWIETPLRRLIAGKKVLREKQVSSSLPSFAMEPHTRPAHSGRSRSLRGSRPWQ